MIRPTKAFKPHRFLVVATVVAGLLLSVSAAGCTPAHQVPAPSAPASTARGVATSTCVLSCGGNAQADHTGPAQSDLTPADKQAALDTAHQVMAAFTNTGVARDQWWTALAPLLTTNFATQAQYIHPSRLPVRVLRSGPRPVEGQLSGNQVRASFDTNAGSWTTIMVRTSTTAPWLASNIGPTAEIEGK
ncbi:hypothetical protein [Arthrobacter sp. ERGS1:01]|uniref:hypothetical protein n=1 Tax=Arthrobacter sp. ERGS1:01 TaxID=1704044 RepID=UPI0006B49B9A|nr:hypothetical protein [Arthrobacter sp. ERGS1:01]